MCPVHTSTISQDCQDCHITTPFLPATPAHLLTCIPRNCAAHRTTTTHHTTPATALLRLRKSSHTSLPVPSQHTLYIYTLNTHHNRRAGASAASSPCSSRPRMLTMRAQAQQTAKQGDFVKVDYTGTLDDNTVFDTSRREGRTPLEFIVGGGQVGLGVCCVCLRVRVRGGGGVWMGVWLRQPRKGVEGVGRDCGSSLLTRQCSGLRAGAVSALQKPC